MDAEVTAVIPRPHLVDLMRAQPGWLLGLALEWAGVVLLVVGVLTVIFLLCLGGYSLVQVTPSR
jgi:hypothetical protein